MRRQAQKDWFAIARTPTWLGRLLIALVLAAAFALLGQWQLSRALPAPAATAKPGTLNQQLSAFTVSPDAGNFAVISGRLQPGSDAGFWLVTNSQIIKSADATLVGSDLTIAWGWAKTLQAALDAHTKLSRQTFAPEQLQVSGVLAESEAPAPAHADNQRLFDSLSLGQLVNVYQPLVERKTSPQFLILQPKAGTVTVDELEPIVLSQPPVSALETINWLSAFYAIEWSVFAGFAVFMWWRLVEDERLRRKAQS